MRVLFLKQALLFALLAIAPVGAFACEGAMQPYDKQISKNDDCSFANAGEGRFGHGSGAAVVDLGASKVGQKLSFGRDGCNIDEVLLFADCSSGEMIQIGGIRLDTDVDVAGAYYTHIRNIQQPIGPIGLTEQTTVGQLIAISEKHDFRYTTDIDAVVNSLKRRNRYDPSCGCKLYYPDSPGAKL